jgi:glycosyltransferase involved in cell wall biosynthesis
MVKSPLLVHEWIEKIGGSEQVLNSFRNIFPDAPILTLWNNSNNFKNVTSSPIANTKFKGKKALSIPLQIQFWNNINIDNQEKYDALIISSHAFAHQATLKNNIIPKYVYCHTPARYLYEPQLDKRGQNFLTKIAGIPLKIIDKQTIKKTPSIAANSCFIQKRIKKHWNMPSVVIYPPVNVDYIFNTTLWQKKLSDKEKIQLNKLPKKFILGASRLVSYKRLDIVIKISAKLNIPAIIVGGGPELQNLQNLAKQLNVKCYFFKNVSNEFLYSLYKNAYCFIFPAIEDFGIMPVECIACGTPVICAPIGGATESVINGKSGFIAKDFKINSFVSGVKKIKTLDKSVIKNTVKKFSTRRFEFEIKKWIGNI